MKTSIDLINKSDSRLLFMTLCLLEKLENKYQSTFVIHTKQLQNNFLFMYRWVYEIVL